MVIFKYILFFLKFCKIELGYYYYYRVNVFNLFKIFWYFFFY